MDTSCPGFRPPIHCAKIGGGEAGEPAYPLVRPGKVFILRRGVTVLFASSHPLVETVMDGRTVTREELTLEVTPPMSPRDEAIFLLHTVAEIEHALMVQYLYAAWSLPRTADRRVARWRGHILQIAREEMAHFAAVQNILRFVGGPLNFDREDLPFVCPEREGEPSVGELSRSVLHG